MGSDINEFACAAKKFATHSWQLGLGFSAGLLEWVASFAAIYLLILDRTNWKTNILTALLVPYIFLTLPPGLFSIIRGDIGKWVAFVAVVLRLFFPHHFPDWLEMPSELVLLVVVAPHLFASTIRGDVLGLFICLSIACYLLQQHIRASGGFRKSFTKANGISNTIGIVLLFVYPAWAMMIYLS